MTIRTSSSHQRYLDLGCQMTRSEIGKPNPRTPTEIHYYEPCRVCGETMRDVDEHGYEDCSRSPYTMDAYGPPDITICTRCAHETFMARNNLSERLARCHCGRTVDSSWSLAFFEYRGPNSQAAAKHCRHCGYYEVAHRYEASRVSPEPAKQCADHTFEPHGPYDYDIYYCGCRGWD